MKNTTLKKKPEMNVVYTHVEPKNEAEAEEYKRRIDRAYEILFEEVTKKIEERKNKKLRQPI